MTKGARGSAERAMLEQEGDLQHYLSFSGQEQDFNCAWPAENRSVTHVKCIETMICEDWRLSDDNHEVEGRNDKYSPKRDVAPAENTCILWKNSPQ
jgi:hypothetical protein